MISKLYKKNVTNTVTTNDIMDAMQEMMQMTSDGFIRLDTRIGKLEIRMDRIEGRIDSVEGCLDRIERDLQHIKAKLLEHDLALANVRRIIQELTDKHTAYINDIADILDRVTALEKQMPNVTKEEVYELQILLQKLVDWAIKAAKTVNVPLDLP